MNYLIIMIKMLPRFSRQILFLLLLPALANSQGTETQISKYDPRNLFPALPITGTGNAYRSGSGEPGPYYWQNRADYQISVKLDDKNQSIDGSEIITYTNNSPQSLPYLWLQLDQNAFKPHSRALESGLFIDSNQIKCHKEFPGGYTIQEVRLVSGLSNGADSSRLDIVVTDTRLQLRLPKALASHSSIRFMIKYKYAIPRNFYNADFNANRTDILSTPHGDIYSIAQWYPRLCVYDDVEGWNTLPYLGNGEFYLEYGNFTVSITLPSAYIVSASGDLVNPAEVLTATQQRRLQQARTSETKQFIRTAAEVDDLSSRPSKAYCTWKFQINNARDFAWTASKSFIWEGIRIDLPSGKKALGISVYPPESDKPGSWQRSSEYIKFTIEYFSKKWFEYPYPCAVNVASNLDGMEYPGIVFCSAKDTGNSYWRVVNHELGHTWFPMIVGSNERKYAWMDEGFNVFIDNMACHDFQNGIFKGYFADEPSPEQFFTDQFVPLLTRPDGIVGNVVYPLQYLKTTYALRTLRDHIVGPERFDYALRKYVHDWAFKHPTPWDFFRSINNGTGEDLSWFWKELFLENYKLDQAISGVDYDRNDLAKGLTLHLQNRERAAMPVIIQVEFNSGRKEIHELPVEIWESAGRYDFSMPLSEAIKRIEIDPENIYADVNRSNNKWMP